MKLIRMFLIVILLFFIFCSSCYAWKTNKGDPEELGTHEQLSYFSVQNSILRRCVDTADLNCDYLVELGLIDGIRTELNWTKKQEVWKWFILGADKEDAGRLINMATNAARFNNHFHNPMKPWEEAGLNDVILTAPFSLKGESSLLWAQDDQNQSDPKWPEGDWSLMATKNNFYQALCADNGQERQAFFAQMFKGLGHQVHLLQDKAVPSHVRNDAHPLPWHIEKWIADNPSILKCLMEDFDLLEDKDRYNCAARNMGGNIIRDENGEPVPKIQQVDIRNYYPNGFPKDRSGITVDQAYDTRTLSPTALLVDTDQYTYQTSPSVSLSLGLAEYTNANFFSDDTIFTNEMDPDGLHSFPEPSPTRTNLPDYESRNILPIKAYPGDGVEDRVICIKQNAPSEEVNCLVQTGYYSDNIEGKYNANHATFYRTLKLDESSHEEYVKHLVPRAVGYSTTLLNYFFRGRLEISPPDQYVYSIIDGSEIDPTDNTQYIQQIKAKVKNNTPDEEMQAGTLIAVAKYKKIIGYQPDLSSGSPDPDMREAEFSYSVSEPIEISSLSSTTPEEFSFNFTLDPIPVGITDLYLQVVFKGTLGMEKDQAIAVGMRDLNEPQHITIWNDTDYFQLNGVPVKAEDIQDDPMVEFYGYIYPFSFTETIGFSREYPDVNPTPIVIMQGLPAARYSRIIVLTDGADTTYYFTDHVEAYQQPDDPNPGETIKNKTWTYSMPVAVHQESSDGSTWESSPVYSVRGVISHQRGYLINNYPDHSYINSLPAPPENDLGPYPTIINQAN